MTSNLLHLPRRSEVLFARVRTALLSMSDSSEMLPYLQGELPRLNPNLGEITLDVSCGDKKGIYIVYILGNYPGMPLTFRSKCLKSCLLRCAQHLCQLDAPKIDASAAIQGIQPIYVRPLPEFRVAR